uniref:Cytochrome c oxidase assembly protein COX16 homolog, mitochondrial n=1 Tax=Amphiprion ocellaris TaxID=80972 RepID=A0A3Q1B2M2_AMPOC
HHSHAITRNLLRRNKTVKYGVPMLLLAVGGFFGLPEFTQIRYDAQKLKTKMDPALEAKVNIQWQHVNLYAHYQNTETEAAKKNSAIINFLIHAWAFNTCQNVFCRTL